ncbi:hypothetical protein HUS23_13085 [Ectothiorhodospiraceae bacterium 2226]|nr:hypothetical protein HUS23_13085 [Ectothiorhodospiraceae bacterium 2226]
MHEGAHDARLGPSDEPNSTVNSAIDLLYSRYSGARWEGRDLHIALSAAYIHKSAGRPGCDHGSAWSQEADLILHKAELEDHTQAGTADAIRAAELELAGVAQDLLPLPVPRGTVRLALHMNEGGRLQARADGLSVRLYGRPLFLEDI